MKKLIRAIKRRPSAICTQMFSKFLISFYFIGTTACSTVQQFMKEAIVIEDGLQYQTINHLDQKVHLATISPKIFQIHLTRGGKPLTKTSEIAKKTDAIIAINAGFFEKDGKPSGAFKLDGEWLQKPIKNRGVVGWSSRKRISFQFDRLKRDQEGLITSSLAATNKHAGWWEEADFIVGGAPLLIHQGNIIDPEPEKTLNSFLERRYARTAICTTKSNQILLIVVEGGDRLSWSLGFRNGLSIAELSSFLKRRGCENALNLDGGKSSTMVLRGKAVNSFPLIYSEREVSDAITITKSRQFFETTAEFGN